MKSLRHIAPAAAIVALAIAAYHVALDGSFHFDDMHAVVDNPAIRSLGNLGRFFVDPTTFTVLPQDENYRPMLLVTYALTAHWFGVSAPAFIAVNLAIHISCALMIWLIARRVRNILGRPPSEEVAWLTGAIFAVHPLFSECVNYVHSRSESLSALFSLISIYCYLRGREKNDWKWLLGAATALFAGLMTKVVAGMTPFLIVAIELAAVDKPQRPKWVARRLLWLFGALAAFVPLYMRYTTDLSVVSRSDYSRWQYFQSQMGAILHYARLFILPHGQCADAGFEPPRSWLEPNVLGSGAVVFAAAGLAAWGLWKQRARPGALAVAWFLLCLAPTSTIFPLGEITNEHRPYLAGAALCAVAAEALWLGVPAFLKLDGRAARTSATVASTLILLTLVVLANQRSRVWHSEETLWRDVVEKAPHSARAHMNYGLTLLGRNARAEAGPHMREATRLAPNYPYAFLNLGLFLINEDRPQAVKLLDRAIEIDPRLVFAQYYRGLAAETIGEPPQVAARYFERAVQLSPTHGDSWMQLSLMRDAAGDAAGALDAAQRLVKLRNGFDDRLQLAFLLLKARDLAAAVPILKGLEAERPDDPRVKQNLEWAARQ
jgi:tetratricopeptide (TPR) repeat protein